MENQNTEQNEVKRRDSAVDPKERTFRHTLAVMSVVLFICVLFSCFQTIYIFKLNTGLEGVMSYTRIFKDNKKAEREGAIESIEGSAKSEPSELPEPWFSIEEASSVNKQRMTTVDIVKKVSPATVPISIIGVDDGKETKIGSGTGFIITDDGYIVTNQHVVVIADQSVSTYYVTVVLPGEENPVRAEIVGSDAQTDIGVLVIDATGLSVAKFGDSKDINIGEDCVVIGCPGGLEFKNSVTKGIVSALDVPIESTIGYNNECIQVDAAINPGNSGGALFNMQGQVIGINSSKIASTEYEGMGFAVPSNTAVSTANSLIKNGYVKGRAKLGISYATFSMLQNGGTQILAALEEKGFKDAQGTMIISEISEDSDLNGKVEKNDMIVAANGETMTSVDVLTSILAKSKPGDTIKLTIARIEGNNIKTFEVTCKLIEAKE